ncbi:class I SAM-dependent methyltransferase [Clostridium sp. LY3-2]|uniref:class I SAM-dependent methyltransferase n=1 Tax=Clostridium sp. LY3-2 TaxID=2942482 RepID=UPI002152A556|nr:class I SAM-dependent methyltransferase [Clostridium sp. LY3-2]MCR6513426.1 class I SAM-dependent methyltransferase [Clostridium sp. LY3-2]
MNREELKNYLKKEEGLSFKGWDFSHLENRWEEEKLPWDYESILKSYLKDDFKLLDMGTGGGEFLLSLNHPYKNTSITENWEPNVKLCKEKLSPLGIGVFEVLRDDELPFEDDTFDLIINRHASFDLKEVYRILKAGGVFITQQVGGKNNEILSKRLTKGFRPKYSNNNLKNVLKKAEDNNFEVILGKEFYPYLRFKDLGALVYFAKIIEWEFPGFSVQNSFEELVKLNEEIEEKGFVYSLEHRYIVVLKK